MYSLINGILFFGGLTFLLPFMLYEEDYSLEKDKAKKVEKENMQMLLMGVAFFVAALVMFVVGKWLNLHT